MNLRDAIVQVLKDGKRHTIEHLMKRTTALVGKQVYGSDITRAMDDLRRDERIDADGKLQNPCGLCGFDCGNIGIRVRLFGSGAETPACRQCWETVKHRIPPGRCSYNGVLPADIKPVVPK